MRLVEVVRGGATSEETVRSVVDLAKRIGKFPALCKDTPGFIANRVARPFYLSGMRLLESGAGLPADIDAAVRTQGGFKMGPLELMDMIGLDVNLSISRVIHEALGRPERLKPCEVQTQLVSRQCLGRKTARGFYLYQDVPPFTVNPVLREILPEMGTKPLAPERIFSEVLDSVIEEAQRAAKEGVASEQDIDTAMCLGLNWPKGPLSWGKELSQRS
jgi:3-hydroxybutyryl-CoA dehydrogenase